MTKLLELKSYINPNTGKKIPVNIINWYMTEKFDGRRAVWMGDGRLLNRNGKQIPAPDWFIKLLPSGIILDGELHMGRGGWGRTAAIMCTKDRISYKMAWNKIYYTLFDIMDNKKNLIKRQRKLSKIYMKIQKKIIKYKTPNCIHKSVYYKIKSLDEMEHLFQNIISGGGEGLVFRNYKLPYIGGLKSSTNAIKYKQIFEAEGVIIGYNLGSGSNHDQLGSFKIHPLVEQKKHIFITDPSCEFSLGGGITIAFRKSNYTISHPIGTVITYKYETSVGPKKIPRFPRYKGTRGFYDCKNGYKLST